MIWVSRNKKSYRVKTVLFVAAFAAFLFRGVIFDTNPEIALLLDEPWAEMQRRSSAEIGVPVRGRNWYQVPKENARLRLADPDYGFVTPA